MYYSNPFSYKPESAGGNNFETTANTAELFPEQTKTVLKATTNLLNEHFALFAAVPSWAVIPSQISNEANEHLDPRRFWSNIQWRKQGEQEADFHLDYTWNLHPSIVLGAPWYWRVWVFWTHSKMEVLTSWRIQDVMAILCRSTSVNTALIRFQLITCHCPHCCFTFNRTLFFFLIIPVPQNICWMYLL